MCVCYLLFISMMLCSENCVQIEHLKSYDVSLVSLLHLHHHSLKIVLLALYLICRNLVNGDKYIEYITIAIK